MAFDPCKELLDNEASLQYDGSAGKQGNEKLIVDAISVVEGHDVKESISCAHSRA